MSCNCPKLVGCRRSCLRRKDTGRRLVWSSLCSNP